nr:uncharacterized protein LOC118878097 [Drosophila suzukii]
MFWPFAKHGDTSVFGDHPGVPTKICLSCLLDLNDAVAFRERCIKTNILGSRIRINQMIRALTLPMRRKLSKRSLGLLLYRTPKCCACCTALQGPEAGHDPTQRSKDLVKIPPKP